MFTRLFLIVACLFTCARLSAQKTKSELDAGAAKTAAVRVDIEAKVGGHDAFYGFQVKNSADTGVFTVRGDGSVGVGNVTPAAMLHVSGKDGLLVTGILDSGVTCTSGGGARLMFYPKKAAFRAGGVVDHEWNDAYIGKYSTAFGYGTVAEGDYSFAAGYGSAATGISSVALGYSASATNERAVAIGHNAVADGAHSITLGYKAETTGDHAVAIGRLAKANHFGSCTISDAGGSNPVPASTGDNQFTARFEGGFRLFSTHDMTAGAVLLSGANSWGVPSDRRKKENLLPADGEQVLRGMQSLNLGTWNYIGQDPACFRHFGAIAQEWFAAFGRDALGIIGNDTTLASSDVDGVLCVAVQALERRTAELKAAVEENATLKARVARLEEQVASVAEIQARLVALEVQHGYRATAEEHVTSAGAASGEIRRQP